MELAGWIELNVKSLDANYNFKAHAHIRVQSIVCVTDFFNKQGEEYGSVIFVEHLSKPFIVDQLKDEVLEMIKNG